jgi:hypothetical protein
MAEPRAQLYDRKNQAEEYLESFIEIELSCPPPSGHLLFLCRNGDARIRGHDKMKFVHRHIQENF